MTDLAYVLLNGKRIYLGRFESRDSRQAYHRILAEWEGNNHTLPAPLAQVTVAELAEAFLDWEGTYYVKPDGSPTGERDNFKGAFKPLGELYGDLPAATFGPE